MKAEQTVLRKEDLPAVVTTDEAARFLNRSPQTLRKWACLDECPQGIRPIKIGGRLAWRVSDLMMLLQGGKA